jgi:hypothetical protein
MTNLSGNPLPIFVIVSGIGTVPDGLLCRLDVHISRHRISLILTDKSSIGQTILLKKMGYFRTPL